MPVSNSNNFVSISRKRNTSPPMATLKIVLYVCTLRIISPVSTLTARKLTTMLSRLYCELAPIPKYLAPFPPVSMLLSYPTIPPSSKIPANSIGCNFAVSVLPALMYSSLVLRIICLSRTRLSKPTPLSTTRNQVPLEVSPAPAALSASISNALAPCVTAVLNRATLSFCLRCPVKSVKLYTATTGIISAGGRSRSFAYVGSSTSFGSSIHSITES